VSQIIETTFIVRFHTTIANDTNESDRRWSTRHHTMLNIRHHELRPTSNDSTLHNRNI